jgi:hypothetical protein
MTSSVSDLELAPQHHHHHHHQQQQQQQQHQYSLNRYYQTKKSATNCNIANGTSGTATNNNTHLSSKYISNSQSTGDLSAIFGRA